jgi:type II secretory pathway pseudopilin PulG
LVELLVVIAIIALLAALLVGVVVRVQDTGKELQTRAELSQLDTAISAFKSKLNMPPPSHGGDPQSGCFRLCTSYASGRDANGNWIFTGGFNANSPEILALGHMFPRINFADTGLRRPRPDGTPVATTDPDQGNYTVPAVAPVLLDPNQCLVVFLSGGAFTEYTGFSTDPAQPFKYSADPNSKRMSGTPFFEFPRNRMKAYDSTLNPSQSHLHRIYDMSPGCSLSNDDRYRRFPNEDPRRYQHPWFVDVWSGGDIDGMPYLYLSSGPNGNGYPTTPLQTVPFGLAWPTNVVGTEPWFVADTVSGFMAFRESNTKFINPNTWQIVSAGPNNRFGPGSAQLNNGVFRLFRPEQPPYSLGDAGGDDMTNFHPRKLGIE